MDGVGPDAKQVFPEIVKPAAPLKTGDFFSQSSAFALFLWLIYLFFSPFGMTFALWSGVSSGPRPWPKQQWALGFLLFRF